VNLFRVIGPIPDLFETTAKYIVPPSSSMPLLPSRIFLMARCTQPRGLRRKSSRNFTTVKTSDSLACLLSLDLLPCCRQIPIEDQRDDTSASHPTLFGMPALLMEDEQIGKKQYLGLIHVGFLPQIQHLEIFTEAIARRNTYRNNQIGLLCHTLESIRHRVRWSSLGRTWPLYSKVKPFSASLSRKPIHLPASLLAPLWPSSTKIRLFPSNARLAR